MLDLQQMGTGTCSRMEDGTNTTCELKPRGRSRVRTARAVVEHERNLDLKYPISQQFKVNFEHVYNMKKLKLHDGIST